MPVFRIAHGRLAQLGSYLLPLIALGGCTQIAGQSASEQTACVTQTQTRERLVEASLPICGSGASAYARARNY